MSTEQTQLVPDACDVCGSTENTRTIEDRMGRDRTLCQAGRLAYLDDLLEGASR